MRPRISSGSPVRTQPRGSVVREVLDQPIGSGIFVAWQTLQKRNLVADAHGFDTPFGAGGRADPVAAQPCVRGLVNESTCKVGVGCRIEEVPVYNTCLRSGPELG